MAGSAVSDSGPGLGPGLGVGLDLDPGHDSGFYALKFTRFFNEPEATVMRRLQGVFTDDVFGEYEYCKPSLIQFPTSKTHLNLITAERNNMAVGYVLWEKGAPNVRTGVCVCVLHLFCAVLRGENVGHAMFMDFAEAVLATPGITHVTWESSEEGVPFYRALGFPFVSDNFKYVVRVTLADFKDIVIRERKKWAVLQPVPPSADPPVSLNSNVRIEDIPRLLVDGFRVPPAMLHKYAGALGWLLVNVNSGAAAFVVPAVRDAHVRQLHVVHAESGADPSFMDIQQVILKFAMQRMERINGGWTSSAELVCGPDGSRVPMWLVPLMAGAPPPPSIWDTDAPTVPKPDFVHPFPGLAGYFLVDDSSPSQKDARDLAMDPRLSAFTFFVVIPEREDHSAGTVVLRRFKYGKPAGDFTCQLKARKVLRSSTGEWVDFAAAFPIVPEHKSIQAKYDAYFHGVKWFRRFPEVPPPLTCLQNPESLLPLTFTVHSGLTGKLIRKLLLYVLEKRQARAEALPGSPMCFSLDKKAYRKYGIDTADVLLAWRNGSCVGYLVWEWISNTVVLVHKLCVLATREHVGRGLMLQFAERVLDTTPATFRVMLPASVAAARPFYSALGIVEDSMSAPAMIYSNSSRLRGFLGLAKSRPWTGTGAPSSKTFLTLGEIEGVTDLGGLDASTSGWLLARRGHWAAFLVPARNKFRVMFAQGKTPEDWKNLRAEVFAFVVDQTAKRSSGPTQLVCGTRDALVPENPLTTDELHRVRHIPVRSWWAIATGSPQSVMPTTVHIVPTAPGFFVADTVSDAKGWTTRYPNLRMLVFSDSAVTEFVNGRETRQFPYKPETQLVAVRPDNLQTVASVFQHPCPEPFIEAMLEESRVSGIKYRRLSPLVPCLYSPTLD